MEDVPILTGIAHRAKRHWQYPEDWVRAWKEDLTVSPETLVDQAVFVAEVDGRIAGFYGLSGDGDERELEHMWVEPELMGYGIGRELLRHAVNMARRAGARRIRIGSDPNAEGFYRAMGAVPAGTVPSYPQGRTLPLLFLEL